MADEDERERRRKFVAQHRTAVFGYGRREHGPSMSVVYYVMDGEDRILVSTMHDRSKARAVRADPHVALCVLDEQWPLTYIQVYATAELVDDMEQATDLMLAITGVMAGKAMPDAARADVQEMCEREHRVVLALSPYATFHTPPRHVHGADDIKGLTHWTSTSLPW